MNLRVWKFSGVRAVSFLSTDTAATSAYGEEEPQDDQEDDDDGEESDGDDDYPGLWPDVVKPVCWVQPV